MVTDLAKKLALLRKQANLSQKEVANRLGLSPSIVSAYETGSRAPSLEILAKLAVLYKSSCDYFLGLDNVAPKKILDTDGLSDEQILALQELIRTMKSK